MPCETHWKLRKGVKSEKGPTINDLSLLMHKVVNSNFLSLSIFQFLRLLFHNECMHSVGINACHILCLHFFPKMKSQQMQPARERRNNMNIELIPQTVSLTLSVYVF